MKDRIDADTGRMVADPAQIATIVMNLTSNALDAIAEVADRKGGEVTIALDRVEVDKDAAAANPEHAAKTDKGGKYWKMALQNWHDKEYQGCVMQIQFALNFEPDNETMIEWKEKAEKKAAEATQEKAGNAYKLRIV